MKRYAVNIPNAIEKMASVYAQELGVPLEVILERMLAEYAFDRLAQFTEPGTAEAGWMWAAVPTGNSLALPGIALELSPAEAAEFLDAARLALAQLKALSPEAQKAAKLETALKAFIVQRPEYASLLGGVTLIPTPDGGVCIIPCDERQRPLLDKLVAAVGAFSKD